MMEGVTVKGQLVKDVDGLEASRHPTKTLLAVARLLTISGFLPDYTNSPKFF